MALKNAFPWRVDEGRTGDRLIFDANNNWTGIIVTKLDAPEGYDPEEIANAIVEAMNPESPETDQEQGNDEPPPLSLKDRVDMAAQRMERAKNLTESDQSALAALFNPVDFQKAQEELVRYVDEMLHGPTEQADNEEFERNRRDLNHPLNQGDDADGQLPQPQVGDWVRCADGHGMRLRNYQDRADVKIEPGDRGYIRYIENGGDQPYEIDWDKGATNNCDRDEFDLAEDDDAE